MRAKIAFILGGHSQDRAIAEIFAGIHLCGYAKSGSGSLQCRLEGSPRCSFRIRIRRIMSRLSVVVLATAFLVAFTQIVAATDMPVNAPVT